MFDNNVTFYWYYNGETRYNQGSYGPGILRSTGKSEKVRENREGLGKVREF